jgi:hypothetical protein
MWEQATFTVPIDISEERVRESVPEFIKKWMTVREKQGWRLLSRIHFDPIPRIEEDRKRYFLYGEIDRKPEMKKLEVPDNSNLIKVLERKYQGKLLD